MRLTVVETPIIDDWHSWGIGQGEADPLSYGRSDAHAARMQYMLNSLENEIGLTYDYMQTPQFFGPLWLSIDSAGEALLNDVPDDEKIEAKDADLGKTFVTLYCASEPHPTKNDPSMEYLTRLAIVIDGENRYADSLHAHREDQLGDYDPPLTENGLIDFMAADDPSEIDDRAINWLGPAHCSSASTIMMIGLSGRYRDAAIGMFRARYGIELSIRSAIKNSAITKAVEDYLSCEGDFAADNADGVETKRRLIKLVDGRLNMMRAC